jgi:hypothetical protein
MRWYVPALPIRGQRCRVNKPRQLQRELAPSWRAPAHLCRASWGIYAVTWGSSEDILISGECSVLCGIGAGRRERDGQQERIAEERNIMLLWSRCPNAIGKAQMLN